VGRHVAFFYEREEHLVEMCVRFSKPAWRATRSALGDSRDAHERDAWAASGDAVPALDRIPGWTVAIEPFRSQTWYCHGARSTARCDRSSRPHPS